MDNWKELDEIAGREEVLREYDDHEQEGQEVAQI